MWLLLWTDIFAYIESWISEKDDDDALEHNQEQNQQSNNHQIESIYSIKEVSKWTEGQI